MIARQMTEDARIIGDLQAKADALFTRGLYWMIRDFRCIAWSV
jgi:hypothetical protein